MTVAVVASIGTLLLVLAVFLGVKHFIKKTDPMTVNKGKRNTALNFHLIFFHSVYKKRKKSVYLIIIKILLQIINMCGGNIYLISPSFFVFLIFQIIVKTISSTQMLESNSMQEKQHPINTQMNVVMKYFFWPCLSIMLSLFKCKTAFIVLCFPW